MKAVTTRVRVVMNLAEGLVLCRSQRGPCRSTLALNYLRADDLLMVLFVCRPQMAPNEPRRAQTVPNGPRGAPRNKWMWFNEYRYIVSICLFNRLQDTDWASIANLHDYKWIYINYVLPSNSKQLLEPIPGLITTLCGQIKRRGSSREATTANHSC